MNYYNVAEKKIPLNGKYLQFNSCQARKLHFLSRINYNSMMREGDRYS